MRPHSYLKKHIQYTYEATWISCAHRDKTIHELSVSQQLYCRKGVWNREWLLKQRHTPRDLSRAPRYEFETGIPSTSSNQHWLKHSKLLFTSRKSTKLLMGFYLWDQHKSIGSTKIFNQFSQRVAPWWLNPGLHDVIVFDATKVIYILHLPRNVWLRKKKRLTHPKCKPGRLQNKTSNKSAVHSWYISIKPTHGC